MSEQDSKKPLRSWAQPVAAAFTLGGIGIYRVEAPASFNSVGLVALALIGAALALIGYGLGRLIDKARE
jgi:hypothetical protein